MLLLVLLFCSATAQAELVTGILRGHQELTLKARSQGEISKILIQEGELVKRGDVIAIIDDEQERIERDLASAEFESARKDFNSTRKLRKYISREEFEKKKDLFLRKKSNKELKEYNFSSTRIRAPFSGIVASQFYKKGEMVSVGDSVATVLKKDQLTMEIFVPARDISIFKTDEPHPFKVESQAGQFFAKTEYVGQVIDSASGTIKVRLSYDNQNNNIVPGAMAYVETSKENLSPLKRGLSSEKME